ncbi:biotin--[acetyl-CoA-carboxylase] ligase [Paenibacillus sp. GSMTC-2017]|uniref:biotin--[acetyl-CoA-carboxylase] ligase n=1 Tax=Paenibacillus sp. GSMTC-2017 TaxID=2794350 RepID=UPI0018D6DE7C|nr:biotin--[acetyl-CoA-carboxylase] ligase [Paenibacillus sp. GSMTC-2017]MBH5317923.1 biotin--[acetyl-CoA-carboxylase] ligase [Paenibacillus sp. GSMTC-2017]
MNSETLLEVFRQNRDQYVSGALMSQKLNVSRTAIWKHIKKLEAAGYEFEASTKLGYRLLVEPDPIIGEQLRDRLTTVRFGKQLVCFEEVKSTQDLARTLAEEGAPEGTLVIAEKQTGGRGRMGRGWVSPQGKGIWMSMIMRPEVPIHCAPQLTLLTAVALCRSLKRITSLPIGIKWPNDLLVNGKKISGILLESAAEDERLKYIIAGIGISVNLTESDYPEELLSKATSLRIAGGHSFDRTVIINEFLKEWEQLYDLFQQEGFSSILSLWESLSVSIGKTVMLNTPQGELIGVPVGLEESGAIRVRREDGSEVAIFSAEMGEPIDRR